MGRNCLNRINADLHPGSRKAKAAKEPTTNAVASSNKAKPMCHLVAVVMRVVG